MFVCASVYIYVCVHMCMHMFVCAYVYYACVSVCMCVYCVYIPMCVCAYVQGTAKLHTYIHTYIHHRRHTESARLSCPCPFHYSLGLTRIFDWLSRSDVQYLIGREFSALNQSNIFCRPILYLLAVCVCVCVCVCALCRARRSYIHTP